MVQLFQNRNFSKMHKKVVSICAIYHLKRATFCGIIIYRGGRKNPHGKIESCVNATEKENEHENKY